jgi:hypothetical protein
VLEGETALEAVPMATGPEDRPAPGKITLF